MSVHVPTGDIGHAPERCSPRSGGARFLCGRARQRHSEPAEKDESVIHSICLEDSHSLLARTHPHSSKWWTRLWPRLRLGSGRRPVSDKIFHGLTSSKKPPIRKSHRTIAGAAGCAVIGNQLSRIRVCWVVPTQHTRVRVALILDAGYAVLSPSSSGGRRAAGADGTCVPRSI